MWDPEKYLAFGDQRGRPFYELVGRIGASAPRVVVDLGCGPGNLTADLPKRWPEAEILALDSSPEMISRAVERGLDARVADLRDWVPDADTDVVISNAALQWVPGHDALLRRWAAALPAGAWLAFQVPGNFSAPSHRLARSVAGAARWRKALGDITLRGADAVSTPTEYASLLAREGCVVDAWETTYLQRLTGEDPVLRWIEGTALRPIRSALGDADWAEFCAELAPRLRAEYPRTSDRATFFPFRRIFVVAHKT
jgi:trans-aconitate 2-methyltransferase